MLNDDEAATSVTAVHHGGGLREATAPTMSPGRR